MLPSDCRVAGIANENGGTTDNIQVEKAKAYADLEAANNSAFTDKLAAKVEAARNSKIGGWLSKNPVFKAIAYGSTYKVSFFGLLMI